MTLNAGVRAKIGVSRLSLRFCVFARTIWRERVGIEPTEDGINRPPRGFEDRENHQAPSAPVKLCSCVGGWVFG